MRPEDETDARSSEPYELHPIGWVRSSLVDRASAPKQGSEGSPVAWLEFDRAMQEGLRDLRAGSEIIVLTWLDRASREVLVTHPRDDPSNPELGVFSTRSPDRPNPIGLHTVEIVAIHGASIQVRHLEALDGTPILDVKPVLEGVGPPSCGTVPGHLCRHTGSTPHGHDAPAGATFGQYAPMTALVVLDQGGSISISFDDLLKYHGRSSIGGVAHAFKAMERAFRLLSPGEPPERSDITVESGFPGGGARDAFEMVCRAVTGDRFRLVSVPAGVEAPEAPGGHFFFRVGYRGKVVDLVGRAGLVPDGFVEVACKEAPTPAEALRARQLKEEMAERLLSLPADEVYDADLR